MMKLPVNIGLYIGIMIGFAFNWIECGIERAATIGFASTNSIIVANIIWFVIIELRKEARKSRH